MKTSDARQWDAVMARDAAADGTFVFAVRTTGVFCRPSCPSRRPRPENVQFFADPAAARRAGFRACKRCRPESASPAQIEAQVMARLCRQIDAAECAPTLRELGRRAGMSPFHLQRVFKRIVGTSPRQYAIARRAERARGALANGERVTKAIYAAGYGSSGRFYGEVKQVLGMQPKRYRAGGRGEYIRFAVAPSTLGCVLVASTAIGVCAILLGGRADELEADLQRRFPRAEFEAGDAAFAKVVTAVVELVERPGRAAELPLDLRGTAFQRRVWQALRRIPAGRTLSYAELAKTVGMPNGARAVARACASNAIAVAVPCHRVVRGDGDLAGYRWGVERKRELLARESGT